MGGERSLLTFLAHRNEAGVEPFVVAPGGGPLAQALQAMGVPRLDWAGEPRKDRGCPAEKRWDALADRLAALEIELVHGNSLMTADAAGWLGQSLRIPAVAHVRDIMRLSAARSQRLASLGAVVAVSEAVAAWLRGLRIHAQRIVRIYNAVEAIPKGVRPPTNNLRPTPKEPTGSDRFSDSLSLRRELGVDLRSPLVGCIGQIALRKGQDLFLESAERIAGCQPAVHFVLVGARHSAKAESRRFEERLWAMSQSPPLAGRVHWLGHRMDGPDLARGLDVLVVPSRQEPLSRVLLEGLAAGVAAVATDTGGMREITGSEPAALLVPPGDPQAMSEAVLRLLADTVLADRLREAGPRQASRFGPGRQARAIRSLYKSLSRHGLPVGR